MNIETQQPAKSAPKKNENEDPSLVALKVPNMKLAQLLYTASSPAVSAPADVLAARTQLVSQLREQDMAPLVEHVLRLSPDSDWLKAMGLDSAWLGQTKAKNEIEVKRLESALEYAEKNFGETEVSDALMMKAHYLCRIGDKDNALNAYRVALEKATGVGRRLDVVFCQLRIGLFHLDHSLIRQTMEKARSLIDEGGDWDRRNRLKVYEGLYALAVRDFKKGASLLLDGLATFTSTELMEYKDFVRYCILSAILVLDRATIKKKVLESPEILEVIHDLPSMELFLSSLYTCRYADFFKSLAVVETILKSDRYLNPHYRWYVREARVMAYSQLLESYRSLTLKALADSFGVGVEFIDRDLSKFIAEGRLHCVIDKVGGVVETNRPDGKNALYQQSIKQGDLLLNHIQKLSRVINI